MITRRSAWMWVFVTAGILACNAVPALNQSDSQQGDQGLSSPQIMLVIDMSGTMGIHVLPDQPIEAIVEIKQQIAEMENDPQLAEFDQKIAEIESNPDVLAAAKVVESAEFDLDQFLAEEGYGSLDEVTTTLTDKLTMLGCDTNSLLFVAVAPTLEDLDARAQEVCYDMLTFEQLADLREAFAYIGDPAYLPIRTFYADAVNARNDLYDSFGYYELFDQREQRLENLGYFSLSQQIEEIAEREGYPTRLEFAQSAAGTLIDLSLLDNRATGRQSEIGLVSFSDTAYLMSPMTGQLDTVQMVVNSLTPINFTNISHGLQIAIDHLEAQGDSSQPSMIILLSDGIANRGMSREEMLSRLAPRAAEQGIRICTVGIGTEVSEIDEELLQGLADQTDGQYLFTRKGEELVNFFVLCRQGLLSDNIIQFTGAGADSETVTAGDFDIAEDDVRLTATVNYLGGDMQLILVDPQGREVDADTANLTIEQGDNIQLITIKDPPIGQWEARVSILDGPQAANTYNVVVSTVEGQRFGLVQVLPFLVLAGLCALVGIPAVVVAFIVLRRQATREHKPIRETAAEPGQDEVEKQPDE